MTYDAARVHERSRIIALAIDARRQRFPDDAPYLYQPLADELRDNRWNEVTRESCSGTTTAPKISDSEGRDCKISSQVLVIGKPN